VETRTREPVDTGIELRSTHRFHDSSNLIRGGEHIQFGQLIFALIFDHTVKDQSKDQSGTSQKAGFCKQILVEIFVR
jgi:hypothetical protein